jgi:flagellar biosynthesis/type III secretory pathway M-ring protein FliF/YscJ
MKLGLCILLVIIFSINIITTCTANDDTNLTRNAKITIESIKAQEEINSKQHAAEQAAWEQQHPTQTAIGKVLVGIIVFILLFIIVRTIYYKVLQNFQ